MITFKQIAVFGTLTLAASCGSIMGVAGKYLPEQEAAAAPKYYSRASIEQSNVAAVRVLFGPQDTQGFFYFAQAINGGNVSYGNDQRTNMVLAGGLITEAYGWGNDLLGVTPNSNDPIMNQRPVSNWPAQINRSYRVFGEGPNGKLLTVKCSYSPTGSGDVDVFGKKHSTTLMSEHCAGDGLAFENSYFVGSNGFIWKSEQWAGNNPGQAILEIIEPLD